MQFCEGTPFRKMAAAAAAAAAAAVARKGGGLPAVVASSVESSSGEEPTAAVSAADAERTEATIRQAAEVAETVVSLFGALFFQVSVRVGQKR